MLQYPIRVLHVQALDAIAGTERTNFTLITGMDRSRFQNEVCVLGHPGPYVAEYGREQIPTHYLKGNPLAFVAVLRRRKFDLIFFYGLKANLLGRLLAPFFSRAIRVEVKHGVDADRGWAVRTLDSLTAPLMHWFVSNSQAGAAAMATRERKPAARITVIPNGIDADSYARPRPANDGDTLRLLAVGNLHRYKGHRFIIEAMALLAAEGIRCHLKIAGEGSERDTLSAMAARVAPGQVTLAGRRADVPEMLANADILVHASMTEGLPNAIMEAMAAGLPVVTTDAGGCAELVLDGKTGFVVSRNSASCIAAALGTMAGDRRLRAGMGDAGAVRIRRHFSLERMIEAFERFVEDKARKGSGAPAVRAAARGPAGSASRAESFRALPTHGFTGAPRNGGATRLLHVVTDSLALTLVEEQLDAMRAAGFEVHVAAAPGKHLWRFGNKGFHIHPVPFQREIAPGPDLVALLRLWRVFRAVKPHVANVGTPKAGLLGSIAAWLTRVPVRIYTLHGMRLETARGVKRTVLWLSESVACSLAHRIVSVSPSLTSLALRLGLGRSDKYVVLNHGSCHGVRCARFAASPDVLQRARLIRSQLGIAGATKVVGFVGRMTRDKGIAELLEAFELVREIHPEARLLLVGGYEPGDPLPPRVRTAIADHPAIVSTGWIDDCAAYYHVMDLLVLPTYREGFPTVILEAGAAGKPVIATRATGTVDAVLDGVTGLLVDRDPQALAASINRVLGDCQLAARMGREGASRVVRDYQPEAINRGLVALYTQLLAQKGVAFRRFEAKTLETSVLEAAAQPWEMH